MAPTGSQKTATYVVPQVLRWDGPTLVTSVKTDVLQLTAAARLKRGPVFLFSPGGHVTVPGVVPCRWDPLADAKTYAGARAAARWLGDSSKVSNAAASTHAQYWDTLGELLLAPLLLLAARGGYGLDQVVRWVQFGVEDDVTRLVNQLNEPEASGAWAATCAHEPRTKSSIYGTAQVLLHPFTFPDVRVATSPVGEGPLFAPELLLDEAATLFIVAPEFEQDLLAPVFEALVNSVIRAQQERAARLGPEAVGPGRDLFLCLEEAANVAPIRKLDKIASAGAAQGIVLMSVWQDDGQLIHVFGRDGARTVVANHTARVYLPGSQDDETLTALSRALGDHRVQRTSTSRGFDGKQSTSRHFEDVPLAPVAWLRERPVGEALVLVGGRPPMRLAVKPYFRDKQVQSLIDPEVRARQNAAHLSIGKSR